MTRAAKAVLAVTLSANSREQEQLHLAFDAHKKAVRNAENEARAYAGTLENDDLKDAVNNACYSASIARSQTSSVNDRDLSNGGNGSASLLDWRAEEIADARYHALSDCMDMRDY